jgi:hypothetical protein
MDSGPSLTGTVGAACAIESASRLDSGLLAQRVRILLRAELGGLDNLIISVSNCGGLIFLEAWPMAWANAEKQALHKLTERSKCITDICMMVWGFPQSSHAPSSELKWINMSMLPIENFNRAC